MKRIGITGNMGSGKTTISRIFQTLGVPVYNADNRAKELMKNAGETKNSIIQLLGVNAYSPEGELNRAWVAQQIFNNQLLLEQLNAIVHPAVSKDFEQWCNVHASNPFVLKEAALLYESGSYQQLDKIIVVTAPELLRIERTIARDQSDEQSVKDRMNKQMPEGEKVKLADFVINNDGMHLLIPQIIQLHHLFLLND
jgi:dephospho-CoA kinase